MLLGGFCYLWTEPGWLFPLVSCLSAKWLLALASYLTDRYESQSSLQLFLSLIFAFHTYHILILSVLFHLFYFPATFSPFCALSALSFFPFIPSPTICFLPVCLRFISLLLAVREKFLTEIQSPRYARLRDWHHDRSARALNIKS